MVAEVGIVVVAAIDSHDRIAVLVENHGGNAIETVAVGGGLKRETRNSAIGTLSCLVARAFSRPEH